MLAPYRQQQFIEKILTDSFGRQYRVLFVVSFVDGEIRGRVISAIEIRQLQVASGKSQVGCFLLGTCNLKLETESQQTFLKAIISPYIELYFFNSQPTRAPSK